MNFNAILAVLVLKGIISQAEGEALVEHLNNKPQSTVLVDALDQVKEVIAPLQAPIVPQLGPVGPAQFAEETAARAAASRAGEPLLPATEQPDAPSEDNKTEQIAADAEAESDKDTKSTPVKKSTEDEDKK